jgi:iron complex outermembrane recepter protein
LASSDPEARLNWVAGFYYNHELTRISQLISDIDPLTEALFGGLTAQQAFGHPQYVINGVPYSSYSNFESLDEQYAIFGEATFNFTSRLKFNVGVRVEHAAVKDQHQILAGPIVGTTYSSTNSPDQTENPVTPRFGLNYHFNPDSMIYVTVAKGYRLGGSNPASVTQNINCQSAGSLFGGKLPATYSSDHLWSYELGLKSEFLEQRVSVQASVYYLDWTDVQSSVQLPTPCGVPITINQGKAVSKGFDLQVAVVPATGLKLAANVGYTDAYYPNAATGLPVPGGGPPQLVNVAGEKLQGILPVTAALHAEYSHAVNLFGGGSNAYARLDYRWLDRLANLDPRDAGFNPALGSTVSDSYGLLNLRVGLQHVGFDISAFVNNLSNSDPRLSFSNVNGGFSSATSIRPRKAGLTLLYRF